MNTKVFLILLFIFCVAYSLDPCGDSSWTKYKDEKCFKLLSTDEYHTREAAENICKNQRAENDENDTTYEPTLAEILSPDEQEVIRQVCFGRPDVFDNVWIRAKRGSDNKFYWNEKTAMMYTNWEEGSPSGRDCVVMVSNLSKRKDGQKYAEERDDIRTRDVDKMQKVLSDINGESIDTQTAEISAGAGLWRDVNCNTRQLVVCQKFQTWSVPKIQRELMQIRTELEFEISKEKIPVGFIYTQLPHHKNPNELWPFFSWTDITSEYAGLFFRAEGDGSESFGTLQEGDSPRLTAVNSKPAEYAHDVTITYDGQWSYPLYSGATDGTPYTISFLGSTGEVRPRNKAIRIWMRSA